MCRATVFNIYLLGDEVGQTGEGNIIRDFPSNIHVCPGQSAKPFTGQKGRYENELYSKIIFVLI
jgi:hypothetical protein